MQLRSLLLNYPAWSQDCWDRIFALVWISIPVAFWKTFPTQVGQGGIFAETLERVINTVLVELLYHMTLTGQWMASTTWEWDWSWNWIERNGKNTIRKTWQVLWQRLDSKMQRILSQTKPHKYHMKIAVMSRTLFIHQMDFFSLKNLQASLLTSRRRWRQTRRKPQTTHKRNWRRQTSGWNTPTRALESREGTATRSNGTSVDHNDTSRKMVQNDKSTSQVCDFFCIDNFFV